jgi:hypothetical protein
MGYIKHHAIVVSSWDDKLLARAEAQAIELGCCVSPIVAGTSNGQRSFLIAPDGSKEGWGASDVGDTQREAFARWADEQRYDDGSTSLSWVEVSFSPDDQDAAIVRHAWGRPSPIDETRDDTRMRPGVGGACR